MDPVGFAASIIQIIDAVTTIIKYVNDVKDASKERSALAMELTSLLSLLMSLRCRAEGASNEESWFRGVRSLGAPNGPLDQFQNFVEKLATKFKPFTSGIRKIGRNLRWPLDKKDMISSLEAIERMKSLIVIALQNDSLYVNGLSSSRALLSVHLSFPVSSFSA